MTATRAAMRSYCTLKRSLCESVRHKKERVPPGDFALLSAPVSLYVSIDLWYNIHMEIRFIVLIIQSNQR